MEGENTCSMLGLGTKRMSSASLTEKMSTEVAGGWSQYFINLIYPII